MSFEIIQGDLSPRDPDYLAALVLQVDRVLAQRRSANLHRERALGHSQDLDRACAWGRAEERLQSELDRLAALVEDGI